MNKLFGLFLIIFITFLFSANEACAQDELVVIQAVSTTKKTFVLNRGARDGVSLHTESLFSTRDVALAARAVEVSREHSLWELNDKRATFPFEKGQLVNFNRNQTNVWSEVADVRERIEGVNREQQLFERYHGATHSIGAKMALSNTFYESISETDSERQPDRGGFTLEGLYHYRFNERLEMGLGARIDRENAVITDPDLTIPSTRFFAIAELSYHFAQNRRSLNNWYTTVGAGVGRSQTEVDDAVSTGLATLLPYVRVGYLIRQQRRLAFQLETSIEAVSTKESFLDTKEQTTNLVNAKVGVGIRF
jgi:hypothetical protein